MAEDIVELVKKVRLVYRQCYMSCMQRATKTQMIRMSAHYEHEGQVYGFPKCQIIARFDGPKDDRLWATNVIVEDENDQESLRGYIMFNPDVVDRDPVEKKFILAEEFLEVAMGFDDLDRRSKRRQVHRKTDYLELFSEMGRRTLWQDSPDDQIEMQRGLRYLLVSGETIARTLTDEFNYPLAALRALIGDSSSDGKKKASSFLGKVEQAIADRRNVDLQLVKDRMSEFLEDAFG